MIASFHQAVGFSPFVYLLQETFVYFNFFNYFTVSVYRYHYADKLIIKWFLLSCKQMQKKKNTINCSLDFKSNIHNQYLPASPVTLSSDYLMSSISPSADTTTTVPLPQPPCISYHCFLRSWYFLRRKKRPEKEDTVREYILVFKVILCIDFCFWELSLLILIIKIIWTYYRKWRKYSKV